MPSRRRHRASGGIGGARPSSRPRFAGPGGRPPVAGATRVLIDGRNVQRALERGSAAGSVPTASLIARLRAAFSPPTEVELILDGHPGGGPFGRVSPGFSVAFSRHATADQVIGDRVAEALHALGPAGAWSVVVVSDDREVQAHARRNGARVEGTTWLAARLSTAGAAGAAIGRPSPARARDLG